MDKVNQSNRDYLSYFGIVISVIAGLIGFYAQSKDPETGLFLFIALIGAIFLYFLISWPIQFINRKFKLIKTNKNDILDIKKDLNSIKEKLDIYRSISKIEAKVSLLQENSLKMGNRLRNKKGQIDPRLVLIVIIIIFLYLFLKSKGYI